MATYLAMPTSKYVTSTTSTWYVWCNITSTNAATTTITDTWGAWNMTTTATPLWADTRTTRPISEAELQAARKHAEAEARAEALLVEHLSVKQREEFRRHRHFTVHGRNHRYRVRKGRMANVDVIDAQGIIQHRLCAHPSLAVPDYDTMLAQKLMLECEEDAFLKVANRHAPRNTNERVLEAA